MRYEKIVLVSTPWPLFNRPSIQLGTLKAYLKSQFPDLKVETHHFYLKLAQEIEYKLYQVFSEKIWLSETVYATLLFPERLKKIEKIFNKKKGRNPLLRNVKLDVMAARVKKISDRFISSIDWGDFGLAGFSICLCQLTSSLYFIRQIKQRFPNLTIVTGGSILTRETCRNLLLVFPEIDFAINGEGELPLSRLIHFLKEPGTHEDIHSIPGIITKKTSEKNMSVSFCQLETLNHLHAPDYDDYFTLLNNIGAPNTFFPTLPVEISRGCWWQNSKSKIQNSFPGCVFCNLNHQWKGYRSKSPSQVVSEIDHLTAKHKTLSVAIMDNTPPVKTSGEIFTRIGRLNRDLDMFCEVRASTPKRILEAMKYAGINNVQVGIEALSTRLLKKLNKGTTAIQNLEIIKNCEDLGIVNTSNLILSFPGSDASDVEETLRNLEFAIQFRPLKCVRFQLGLGSPVSQKPREFGLRAVFNHRNYAAIFPPKIYRSIQFMSQGYHGDLGYQKKLWLPVRKKVKAWQKTYEELHKGLTHSPILSFRDGGDFLIIRERRLKNDSFTHRLTEISRSVYLYCQKHHSIKKILGHFHGLTEEKLIPFLKMMTDKKLMFEEDGKYLSLAVSMKRKN